jgi:hypothetical protein
VRRDQLAHRVLQVRVHRGLPGQTGKMDRLGPRGQQELREQQELACRAYRAQREYKEQMERMVCRESPELACRASKACRVQTEAPVAEEATPLWQAYGSMSSVSFSNTENNITWGSLAINPNSDISLSGSEITINTAGVYKFTVTLRTDSSNRTELFVKTYLDNGAGYNWRNTDIVSDYVSRDNDQDTGAVTLITALSLSATNKIQFRGQGDCDGTCVSLNDGTILIIERVA